MPNRRGIKERAGTQALSLLGTPPNPFVLRALAEGSSSLAELQSRGGSPRSTLRTRLRDLIAAGVIAQRSLDFPRVSAYELTPAGEELLFVAEALERWLGESPTTHCPLGGEGAKAAIGALAEGWSATLLRALAAKPLSIADLDSLIVTFNYPSLERRIAAMRLCGQVEACVDRGREIPYAVTAWLRHGVAPLLAAIRWEQRHPVEDVGPLAAIDVEAVFLLAMPMLKLSRDLSGRCRFAVELPKGDGKRLAGALTELQEGALTACSSRLEGSVEAWASGPVAAWLGALIDGDMTSLELGGDGRLARAIVGDMHRVLFGATARDADTVQLFA